MNPTESYIKYKTRYDEMTKFLSLYFFGKKYANRRILLNIFLILSVLLVTWWYSESIGNYYYLKLFSIFAAIDIIGIIWLANKDK